MRGATITFLFTDIEGSTRLWEDAPELMGPALARHNILARKVIESNRGTLVKNTGDGVYAVFDDPLDALGATLLLQQALADDAMANAVDLRLRCGLHLGTAARSDDDFFGSVVNRASRIMSAAHGGQVLVSEALAAAVRERLPSDVTLNDLGVVRLRDLTNPERIFQAVHPRLRQDFPALRSLEATPNNLPQQVTSFIGRERELAEGKRLLADTRLLSFVGSGGLGKTRLTLQLAAETMDTFPDGVWFVELASLEDERLVPQAVASVLGVKEQGGREVTVELLKHVRDRRLLLILDNCEHLIHACADFAKKMLQSGAQLKIIVSSRELLRVPGETTYVVPALDLPDVRQDLTVAALSHNEAVRVFIERAVAAEPAFRLTAQNARAVADICHRLDGIPLALELAAARVRTLPVDKIAARLGDRFRLLVGGDRTGLARQQTLRASIDWSYGLLTDAERTLLRRLAIFSGGWTLEAAESVCAYGAVDERDVLALLTNLVEKSLVVLQANGERYRLLESVRQYAQERLIEASEEDEARARHMDFYVALAETAEPQILGADQGEWEAILEIEQPNFLLAHASCERAQRGATAGLRLAFALRNYWIDRGLLGLGLRLALAALTRSGGAERGLLRCRALLAAASLEYFMGHYREAAGHSRESLAIAEEIGAMDRAASALTLLGHVALAHDPVSAREHYSASLALARKLGDKRRLGNVLNGLAILHLSEGDLDQAESFYEEVLALDRERGEPDGIALSMVGLASVSIQRGLADRALHLLLEALEIADKTGMRRMRLIVLFNSIALAALLEEWEQAARFFGWTEAERERTGLHREPSDDTFLAPWLARMRAALDASAFAAADAVGRALSYDEAMAQARSWLKRLAHPPAQ